MEYKDLSKTVLVTGGNGLVGSEMIFGNRINREVVDLTDHKQTVEYIGDTKPEWIIHCAGLVGGVAANMNRKADFFSQNLQISLNIFDACQKAKVQNLVMFMSTCIFPDEKYDQLTEDTLHDGAPHDSNYGYAYAKRMIDVGIRTYKEQYGMKNWFSLIPTNLYGKNDNYNLETSHFIPALIRKAHIASTKGELFTVWGNGKPIRDFVYSEDIARLIYHIIINDIHPKYDKFIVSPTINYRIKDVAEIIRRKFNIDRIYYDTSKPNGQYKKTTDSSRFFELFPDFKFTPLDLGLDQTITYYLNNQDKIRI
jgi:GDP-L-fucose synthase